jgi:hypothetical protein
MRELLLSHKDMILKIEKIEQSITNQDQQIGILFDYIKQLLSENEVVSNRNKIGF